MLQQVAVMSHLLRSERGSWGPTTPILQHQVAPKFYTTGYFSSLQPPLTSQLLPTMLTYESFKKGPTKCHNPPHAQPCLSLPGAAQTPPFIHTKIRETSSAEGPSESTGCRHFTSASSFFSTSSPLCVQVPWPVTPSPYILLQMSPVGTGNSPSRYLWADGWCSTAGGTPWLNHDDLLLHQLRVGWEVANKQQVLGLDATKHRCSGSLFVTRSQCMPCFSQESMAVTTANDQAKQSSLVRDEVMQQILPLCFWSHWTKRHL